MNWLMLTGRDDLSAQQQVRIRRAALFGGLIVVGIIVALLLLKDVL